jgi:NAD(P)H dehydrogenase (quinone)
LNLLVVFDHPRRDSFCGAVLDSLLAGLTAAGHTPELADLRAEGFDPRLPPEDEPDWNDADKVYSDAVLAEQARMTRNDALAFVFPVWWWSLPATTKGWIDRVWNNGWAYGARSLKHKKALLLGTAAGSAAGYEKRGYDQAMRIQTVTGMMEYCGIPESELHLLFDVLDDREARSRHLARVRELGERISVVSGWRLSRGIH